MKPDDDKIDRLLARGNLAGPEYDRIFERVLARTETVTPVPARRWLAWGLVPGAAVATGLAAWLLLVRPSGVGGKEPGAAGFATRGLVGAGGGALEIGCSREAPPAPGDCREEQAAAAQWPASGGSTPCRGGMRRESIAERWQIR